MSVTNNILLRFYKNVPVGVIQHHFNRAICRNIQWQTVRIGIGISRHGNLTVGGGQTTVDYNWNYDVTPCNLHFPDHNCRYIPENMYISTEGQEMYDYYYDDLE